MGRQTATDQCGRSDKTVVEAPMAVLDQYTSVLKSLGNPPGDEMKFIRRRYEAPVEGEVEIAHAELPDCGAVILAGCQGHVNHGANTGTVRRYAISGAFRSTDGEAPVQPVKARAARRHTQEPQSSLEHGVPFPRPGAIHGSPLLHGSPSLNVLAEGLLRDPGKPAEV
jgi:hypothetical protein